MATASPARPGAIPRPVPAGPAAGVPTAEEYGVRKRPKMEKRRGLASFLSPILRFLQLAAAVCAFATTITSSEGNLYFQNIMTNKYLVAGTVIAAAWALLMLIVDLIFCCIGRYYHSTIYRWIILAGDFVAASFALTAGSAGGGMTTFFDQGAFPYPSTPCLGTTQFGKFCSRTKAGTALAIITFFFFIPSILLSSLALAIAHYEE